MTNAELQVAPRVSCNCGWSSEFPASSAGLEIECPDCGRIHRLPVFGNAGKNDETISVHFRGFFIASAVLFCVCVVVGFSAFDSFYPNGLVVVGAGAAWPLGLLAAWRGQTAQRRRGDRLR